MGKKVTQAVAGTNSLNSRRWNPRILCNSKGGQGIQQDNQAAGGSLWQVP